MTQTLQTERTTVHRLANRAVYDRDAVHAILDEGLICHIGFVVDGAPVVIPTIHWREGETLYFHGSVASRMLRSLKEGLDVCVTVTLIDGLVLARSAFHHSINYRSVVVFGKAREVTDRDEKLRALDALVEHVIAGRSSHVRPPNESEIRLTSVLALPIEEASAKVRTGGPVDDEEDYAMDVWAGVLPLALTPSAPIADTGVSAEVPEYVRMWDRLQPVRTG
ncbi:MAG TPA: pyridoxamine 5'-phosphate oxidase family protein [Thermoanaerobaculia bacterium]|nr:pyridoxamine 5'-phosphate oxidase family protein [Thermoanaerobaculia bacterium]